ncbi:MAG: hypothetical protein IIT78_01530 [Mycoplasmataceae bacterium]|nr:hypothetical protein [Mycoplasmataceae bacterium]
MSHSVTFVTFNLTNDIKQQCSDILNRLQSIKQYDWKNTNTANTINDLLQQYHSKIDEIYKLDHKTVNAVEVQSILATIMKDIANMQQFANASIAGFYKTYLENASQNINKIIAQYGILATTALQKLEESHQIINDQNLLNTIDEIRNSQINEQQLKIYHSEFKKAVDKCTFPDDIKLILLNLVSKYTTAQEVSDIAGFIATKNAEFNRMVQLIKDVSAILKEVNFKFAGNNIKYLYNEEEGVFSTVLLFKNSNNNTIAINFNSLGKLSYKLGNYIGHACEQTSRSILEKLKQKGYEYSTPIITRNISSAKPLEKSINTFNERNKK